MQEEVDEKTVALVINGGRISGNILKSAMAKFVQRMEEHNRIVDSDRREAKKAAKTRQEAAKQEKKAADGKDFSPGKKSLKQLMREGSQLSNIEITDNNIKSFERVARKYGIEFSLKKDKFTNPPRYLVFFRAKDVDVMTAAFKEYTGVTMEKSRKVSIRKRLKKAISRTVAKHREREKTRQKDRGQVR